MSMSWARGEEAKDIIRHRRQEGKEMRWSRRKSHEVKAYLHVVSCHVMSCHVDLFLASFSLEKRDR